MALLVIAEIFVANGSRRHKAVGAGAAELHEQPGAGDAGNASVEARADTIGEEMSDQAISWSRARPAMARRSVAEIWALISASASVGASGSPPSPSFSARISPRCTIRSA